MADPLSIAASIAGLISLADVVFIRLVKFGRSAMNAEKEIQDLSREVNLIGGAVNSLDRLAQALQDGAFDTNLRMHVIEDCSDTLEEINKRLRKLEASSSLTKQKLMWPFTKDRVKKWIDELSQHKANINMALSANSLDAMLRALSQEEKHAREILAEVKETRKITSRIHQDTGRRKVLEFFLKYNPQRNYDMSIYLRHPRTGLWLQKHRVFQHWLSNPGSRLWLKGIPGAGKTVLAGSIIESVLKRNTEATPCAFFFCDYKEGDTQAIENILGALVYQLAIQKEGAYAKLERHYDELHPSNNLPKQLTRKGLQRLLMEILQLFDHTYLIIDALDECGQSTDEVVETLSGISEVAENVSIALLSRDEDRIRDRIEGSFVAIEIAANKADITEYVTAEIEGRIRTRKLRIGSLDLKREILQGLIDGAKGMFRWVACQLDHLGDCDSDQQCRDALKSLPPTLNETYERILRRVPKSKQTLIELALNCIAYASPKLDIHQLREILSVPAPGQLVEPSTIIREESITRYCSSLVRKSADSLHLEFSHFSVQEFLEKSSLHELGLEWLQVSKSRAYSLLAIECLKFIQLRNFQRANIEAKAEEHRIESRNELHPLYLHASIRWPIYARGDWDKQVLFDLAASLFHPSKTSYFTSWAIQIAVGIRNRQKVDVEDMAVLFTHPDFTPLHMAAALSLPRICSFLVEHGMRVNLESPVGRPLQCAVQSLQFGSVNQTVKGRDYQQWVIPEVGENQRDHAATLDTIRCLCREGASLNLQCSHPFSSMRLLELSLFMVGKAGTLRVAMTIIEEGARVEETDSLLLQQGLSHFENTPRHGADIRAFLKLNEDCAKTSPAHHRISSILWEHAVALEFEFTSDPTIIATMLSIPDGELEKHAAAAVATTNAELLKKVLSDPRFQAASFVNDDGDSLLHLALRRRRETDIAPSAGRMPLEVVKLLLDAKCDVAMTNRRGIDPLQSWNWSADDMENPTADELLLFDEAAHLLAEHGASCVRHDSKNRNALHLHISEPFRLHALLKTQSEEKVRKAMEMVDNDGYTPLTLSLRKKFVQSASILLAQQTTLTTKMTQSPTAAPSLAVRAGDEKSFECLLLSGINFGFDGTETPLHYVGPQTSLYFVCRLKALYPEACGYRFNGRTPLESYLSCCLKTSGVRSINASVIDELSVSEISPSETSKAATWDWFASQILNSAADLSRSWIGVRNIFDEKDDRSVVSETASMSLIRLGYLESFESCFGRSGIIPIVQPFNTSKEISDLWPQLSDLVFEILRQTQHWESLGQLPGITLLLQAAVHCFDFRVARLLLCNGISVHQRAEGLSVLESFVSDPLGHLPYWVSRDTDDEKAMLDLVLSHSDKSRMNEVIPDGSGRALVHLLGWLDANNWILEKIVGHGANPNLRLSEHPHRPAAVHYFFTAMNHNAKRILKIGADPTLADDFGQDSVLMAAMRGDVLLLAEIHSDIEHGDKKDWHDKVDWRRKCRITISVGDSDLSCNGVTAMHLGALCASADVLRFYKDRKLIEDLEVRSHEGHTPLHFAASQGSVSNIIYLSSRGSNVNTRAEDGSSPLHLAAMGNKIEAARTLIRAGSTSFANSAGMTPAAYAHQVGNDKLAALLESALLGSGVPGDDSPDQQIGVGLERLRKKSWALAFKNAIKKDDLALCKYLHVNGCDLTTSISDCAGGSLISEAIALKRVTIIKWMLQQGVSMTTAVSKSNPVRSAIHLVVKDADLVDVLPACLDNYAQNGGRILGEIPSVVCTAILSNNIKGLEVILRHAKDNQVHYGNLWSIHPDRVVCALVNEFDTTTGWTPLHKAADCGALAAVQVLLQSGADIDVGDSVELRTPLHIAIGSTYDVEEKVALYLIRRGANIERRNRYCETPAVTAAEFNRTRTLSALINAKADIHVNGVFMSIQDYLVSNSGKAFADLIHRGVDPYRLNFAGYSAFDVAVVHTDRVSFILNSNFRLEDATPFSWGFPLIDRTAWITNAYPLFLKKYGLHALRKFAGIVPTSNQAPLCKAAEAGLPLVMKGLLALGAPMDLEGCPSGSALMAACEFGRKESVEYLVRRGAVLSYNGANGFRSAIKSAKGNEKILRWLLVDRFIDQQKLTEGCDGIPHDETNRGPFSWGGPIQAELVISGRMERLCHQSSREYWSYLMKEKIRWRGRILPSNTRRRTVSHSNIVPREIVRIHPQGYNSNGHEEAWFSKKAPKIQSDGRCWYLSYIDTP